MENNVSSVKEAPISMESKEESQEYNPFSKKILEVYKGIPILEKNNYEAWKEKIENFLKNEGLGDFVPPGHIRRREDLQKRQKIKFLFRKKCGACVLPYIEGIMDITLIWKQLATMYEFPHPTKPGMKMMMDGTNYSWCPPLHKAIVDGDWKTFSEFKSRHDGQALTAMLTSEGELPLHVAVQCEKVKIVKELIEIMDDKDLSRPDKDGRSALHIAASAGNLEIVKALVRKKEDLVKIRSEYYDDCIPVIVAARAGNKDVVNHLYKITVRREGFLTDDDSTSEPTRFSEIFDDFNGKALDLLQRYPKLVLIKDANNFTAIDALSRKPFAFKSSFPTKKSGFGTLGYYFQKFMYSLLDVHVNSKNACCHTRGDVENSLDANGERSQGRNMICGKGLSLCFHWLFQNALKLVPGHKHIYEEKLKHHTASKLLKVALRLVSEVSDLGSVEDVVVAAMYQATQNGIVEFIQEIINNCPQLLLQWYPQSDGSVDGGQMKQSDGSDHGHQTIFHYAISNRQEKIFNLIHDLGPIKNDIAGMADKSKNLMSHLAAREAPIQRLNQVPGAALQLQRELLWYKEVERIMPPTYEDFQNNENKTPRMLFIEAHKKLVQEGATWMKDTATQCMVVATLITTIMFAAVFTIPGSKESDHTGEPNYIRGKFPIVYVISNILALCSSVASMLMFLAIITSRYSEEDFLKTLPRMLMMGLFFLFISIVGMMIEFVSAILVMLRYEVFWVSFPIVFIASIPITIYALVELPLFIQLMFSTTFTDAVRKRSKQASAGIQDYH
ncbi:uncharacterized protein LOC122088651 isoform X2 [Macadamia integrifolia]|uniref:uncharacterized protein LOC122088651 isoform X2 n=1 Tax=Macadamia integrifolia TaxID=60698 RepID=UPI001C4EBAEC|nr:uncharacterized protein LOC122088651 isoform X2 [Macadamia integrifolia]